MRFAYWSREVAGWVLVAGGLFAFVTAYGLLLNKRVFEAAPMTFIGFIVFRGGIHVLKVAVAAQAATGRAEEAAPAARKIGRLPTRSVAPTANSAVKPGPRTAPVGTPATRN
ncbi:MAG TPA: hypothetical protein VM529_16255 [Gemmata sp.]|nr:hypothetical protein [Gemmata sp.]